MICYIQKNQSTPRSFRLQHALQKKVSSSVKNINPTLFQEHAVATTTAAKADATDNDPQCMVSSEIVTIIAYFPERRLRLLTLGK